MREEEQTPAYKRVMEWDLKGVVSPSPLCMKCLLCSRIKLNPSCIECDAYGRKPDEVYYGNMDCSHFERGSDEKGLFWINGYVGLSGLAYVPRPDDMPPDGWEGINVKFCGEDWKDRV